MGFQGPRFLNSARLCSPCVSGPEEQQFTSVSSRNTVGLGEVGTGFKATLPIAGSLGDSGLLRLRGLP